ncbi:putative phytochrome sensor protein [Rippkaea orientalis PCC 8801]|uniref:Putative phytochrome sensor protein n=1 Tax=Rippkaea orientalis (strain PCC 8801 / RF-1) TaxID=41431 RepID=B7K4E4_RIPO1|nr:GAF domain-containing protein [Rippkaea orientalis]ACK65409.1 putative phytochrome sensor protein [Rippkaea orientalis PCC 8801]
MDKLHDFLFRLAELSNLLEEPISLEQGLEEVTKLTAQILQTERCSIMLLSNPEDSPSQETSLRVFTHYGNLPPCAYQEVTKLNQGIAGYVAATGKSLFIKDLYQSEFVTVAHYLDDKHKSLISVPILLAKQVVGVINVSHSLKPSDFEEDDLKLLEMLALFVGKSLHISHLQSIMRSKFIELAVARDLTETKIEADIMVHPNPTKLAKIVAKSFFKELTQAGFGPNQVIAIATEVLNLLQESLDRHKKRRERD